MKLHMTATAFTACLLAGTAVSASPAEDFGKAMLLDSTVSAQTQQMAAQKLSGDDIDEQIVMSDDLISTQSVGIGEGHAQLAAAMGVDPADYTNAELVKMYVGEYN